MFNVFILIHTFLFSSYLPIVAPPPPSRPAFRPMHLPPPLPHQHKPMWLASRLAAHLWILDPTHDLPDLFTPDDYIFMVSQ